MTGRGSTHEGDGGWPYRDIKGEQKEIERLRRIVPSEDRVYGIQTRAMKVLDLFCGMGGWSIGFHREGFDCVGIDIADVGYPYRFYQQDIRDYHYNGETKPDIVVASPPCTEFSQLLFLSVAKGQRHPGDPEKGMELVREAKRVIDEAQPRWWLIENVNGSIPHISKLLGKPKMIKRPYILWGEFPQFLMPQENLPLKTTKVPSKGHSHFNERVNADNRFNPMRSWLRARIPIPLSLGLARACKATILGG